MSTVYIWGCMASAGPFSKWVLWKWRKANLELSMAHLLFIIYIYIYIYKYIYIMFTSLSHTWVRYPAFSGIGVQGQILTTVVPVFSGDLTGCSVRSKWALLEICTLPKIFFAWNKLFRGEITFSKKRTCSVKSLCWQIVPMQEPTY